jgi:hypothetical protein
MTPDQAAALDALPVVDPVTDMLAAARILGVKPRQQPAKPRLGYRLKRRYAGAKRRNKGKR